jgi:hypothetical protein
MRKPTSQRLLLTVACALGAMLISPPATAQNEMVLIKSESGCSFYALVAMSEGFKAIPDIKMTWRWSGECVGDLAQGMGRATMAYSNQFVTGSMSIQQHYHAGYPLGYGRHTAKSGNFSSESWLFSYQGKMVGFNGMGLEGSESLVSSPTILMPTENPSALKKNDNLFTPTRNIQFLGSHCGLHKARFSDCGFGEGEKKHEVYLLTEMQRTGNPKADYAARKETFCPNPLDGASCVGFASTMTAPHRAEVLAFIAQSKAGVDETFVRMNAVLVAAGKAAPNAAAGSNQRAAIPVNGSTTLGITVSGITAPGAIARSSDPAFMQSLNTYTVGQLFSMADDYESKSDKPTARAILRKLIERFPDHALAGLAAKQLVAMQDK